MMALKLLLTQLKGYIKTAGKISVIVIAVFTVINLFAYSINKNRIDTSGEPTTALRTEIYKTIHDPQANKTKEGKAVIAFYRAATCGLMGEGCTSTPSDGDRNFPSSFFGRLTAAVAFPYANPPASGMYWVHNTLENAGFVPKTYAAEGIGFAALKPLIGVWRLFRDLAFSALVIYLIVSGLLIMFRFKLNAQTVISIENSLPRVFISLIIITFSFAIAGLLLDLMYVVSALAVSIVGGYSPENNGQPYLSAAQQSSLITRGGFGRLFDEIFGNFRIIKLGYDFFQIAPTAVNIALRGVVGFILISLFRATPLDWLITGRLAGLDSWCGGVCSFLFGSSIWLIMLPILSIIAPLILGLLIMIFTGLYLFIRIIVLLFAAYIRILLNTLFAPLILLLGVLPGRSMVGNWMKMLIADLIVFPIVMVMITLSGVMAKIPYRAESFWQPPFLFHSVNPGAFQAILSLGIMFLIPQVVKSIRGLLGIKPIGFNMGAGLFFAGLTGMSAGGMGVMSKYGSIAHGAQGLSRIKGPVGKFFGSIAGGSPGGGGGGAHFSAGGAPGGSPGGSSGGFEGGGGGEPGGSEGPAVTASASTKTGFWQSQHEKRKAQLAEQRKRGNALKTAGKVIKNRFS